MDAPPHTQSLKVAVIGAGAAGLVAARELQRAGHRVIVFEQGHSLGGVWKYSPQTEDDPLGIRPDRAAVHGSMYASLRTNLPREIMGYLDFPFLPKKGRDERRFPGHEEVLLYLQDFAAHFRLHGLIRFGREVKKVAMIQQAVENAHFNSLTENGPSKLSAKFDKRNSDCAFGRSENTQEYKLQGLKIKEDSKQPVTVQEGSNSRIQWRVSSRARKFESKGGPVDDDGLVEEVFDAVVVCNGHYSQPRIASIPGIERWPGTQIHSHNYRMPEPFRDQVVIVIGNSASGEDISKEIAKVAKEVHWSGRTWKTSVDMSQPIGAMNIWRQSLVDSAYVDGTVRFQNGASVVADVILYCTGYSYSFPFLDTQGIVAVDNNHVGPLYQHVFPPMLAPSLSFVGLPFKSVSGYLQHKYGRYL